MKRINKDKQTAIMSTCRHRKSGATLIITLGILSVISILAVSFLLSARLQKQTSVTSRNRLIAENAIHAALATAILQIEKSLSYTNFTDIDINDESYQNYQRMAPVSKWFNNEYAIRNGLNSDNPDTLFQYGPVLTSPAYSNAPSINLITPEVLSLIPPALTNNLPLYAATAETPLRSGWIPFDPLENASMGVRLRGKSSRIAFALFDCSGTIDANLINKPKQTKNQRIYFSQKGINTDFTSSDSLISQLLKSNNVDIVKEESPFFHTSYDPNPNTFRYHAASASESDILGRESFSLYQPMDLNTPGIYQAISALTSGNLAYNKFNINNITNILRKYNSTSVVSWQDDFQLITDWLMPTWYISEICRNRNTENQDLTFDNGRRLAWSIANFIDPNRIPDVSHFVDYEMPTRANYAVEDVPLISKISIFKVKGLSDVSDEPDIGPERGPEGELDADYYGIENTSLSNHYAVAVELWYPFAPNSPYGDENDNPGIDPACYVGIYTNEADISTTTNRAPSLDELGNYFGTNIIMKVLFETWAREYEKEVGWEYLDGNPLWQEIRNIGDYWFTPAMINNPLWKEATDNGEEWYTVVITNSPLYGVFYPETYVEIATNETGVIATNTYTYITQTNYWLNISYPGMTNEFIYGEYVDADDQPYMVMYWEDSVTEAITNSILGGIKNENNDIISLAYTNNIALSIIYGETPDKCYLISENADTGVISTNLITALILSPDIEPLQFDTYTNIFNRYTVTLVTPLEIPAQLEQALNELFLMLPTNSISAMHDFMLLTADDVTKLNLWNDLFDYFSSSPGIQQTIIPQIIEPSLGNMTEDDKYGLDPQSAFFDPETTTWTETPDPVNGFFWTVYPKQTVSFLEIIERIPIGEPSDSTKREIVTNCYALGDYMPGNSKPNTVWIRPVTTIYGTDIMAEVGDDASERPLTDRIVDEALMLAKDNDYNNDTVKGWTSVTNIYVADPRDNAYANRWLALNSNWPPEDDIPTRAEIHYGVKELPFIHLNSPLQSIGDLGHIYTEYRRVDKNGESGLSAITGDGSASTQASYSEAELTPEEEPADTINFSSSSTASLLDFFTIKPDKPERGLVQANTTLKPTLDILFSNIMLGWTNCWFGTSGSGEEDTTSKKMDTENCKWDDLWCEALTNDIHNAGWRCFADMLPDLVTNEINTSGDVWNSEELPYPMHNYTEDVLRGIIDKVSFRQNVFVIVLAAQTLAPGTSETNPNVLAEQRVAVTVIRDAYSGNWAISDWRKLQ